VAGDLKRFPLPVFSQYTLARAAYEPALLTLWLLDPAVDSVERIGLGYAAQLRSLDDLRKFQSDARMTARWRTHQSCMTVCSTPHEPPGTSTETGKGRKCSGRRAQHDRSVQPVRSADRGRYASILSRHAHGREWAMMRGASAPDLLGFDTTMNIIRIDLNCCATSRNAPWQ
jgi:hypothetical protein